MDRKSKWIILILSVYTLAGCQQQRVRQTVPQDKSFSRAFAALQSYQVSQLEIDYVAKCRIRIKTPGLDQNGSCQLNITRDNRFRITVHSLLGGTLLMIYQDAAQIQVLNYHNKTYLHLKNNEMNRYKAFEIVNLNVAEFRSIFWGREIEGDTRLRFVYEDGRPAQIRKLMRRSDQLITIGKWFLYRDRWFPRTIEFVDQTREVYLKVVITSFSPGLSGELLPAEVPGGFQNRQ